MRRSLFVGSLRGLVLFTVFPAALHAQELPAGVTLGMQADELRRVLPDVEKVRHPRRMTGGLVGAWRSSPIQMLGLEGRETFFFAQHRLSRVEFAGSTPDGTDTSNAFDRLVAWGRKLYGPEIAANDAGASYAEWSVGDMEVYAQYAGSKAEVRLVYKLRPERDASQL
jgi:hypothetical protein